METSYFVGEEEIIIPLRCCVEARKDRIRTVIQKYQETSDVWTVVFRSQWVKSLRAHWLPEKKLDEAACIIADTIEEVVGEETLRHLHETSGTQHSSANVGAEG